MAEGDAVGVQCLARDDGLVAFLVLGAGQVGEIEFCAAAVLGVADDGMADGGHVHADLMCAAGLELDADERESVEPLPHFVDGDCLAARLAVDGDFLALLLVAGEREVDDVGVELRLALDDGEVEFLDVPPLELPADPAAGGFVLDDDHDPGGVAVEPVDDSRPHFVVGLGQGVAVVDECVDEGAAHVAACGMDDDVGLLVDDEDVVVFVDDVDGDIFGLERVPGEDGQLDVDVVAALDLVVGFDVLAVDGDFAVADERGEERAGVVGELGGEVAVEPPAGHGAAGAVVEHLDALNFALGFSRHVLAPAELES